MNGNKTIKLNAGVVALGLKSEYVLWERCRKLIATKKTRNVSVGSPWERKFLAELNTGSSNLIRVPQWQGLVEMESATPVSMDLSWSILPAIFCSGVKIEWSWWAWHEEVFGLRGSKPGCCEIVFSEVGSLAGYVSSGIWNISDNNLRIERLICDTS